MSAKEIPLGVQKARTSYPLGLRGTQISKNLFHANPEPGAPGRGRARNVESLDESGCAVPGVNHATLSKREIPPGAQTARTAHPLGAPNEGPDLYVDNLMREQVD